MRDRQGEREREKQREKRKATGKGKFNESNKSASGKRRFGFEAYFAHVVFETQPPNLNL